MSDSSASGNITSINDSSSVSSLPSDLDQLAKYLVDSSLSDLEILQHCLGLQDLVCAPPLAKNMLVIAFDTESWIWDHEKVTEIGFCIIDSRDMCKVKDIGPHGQNLLQSMYWYHVRIQPNAHLINKEPFHSGNPDANRFGTTRFLTLSEANDMLTEIFGWAVSQDQPELGNCPVVVLGHALNNDLPKLRQMLGFDYSRLGTVVKTIDTQNLAQSTGFWSGQPIGLERMVNRLGFKYRDPHTACNDIGMTVVAAVQLVLPTKHKVDQTKSLQEVVDRVETRSKTSWSHGSATYCLRCNRRGHLKKHCHASIKPCVHCSESGIPARERAARYHQSHTCIGEARKLAAAARESSSY